MKLVENVMPNKAYLFKHRTVTPDRHGYSVYHAHQGLELLYVEQGEGHVIIEQQLVPIRPGTIYCFQPYQLHRVHALTSPEQPYIRSILVFEPIVFEPFLSSFPEMRAFLHKLWKEKLPFQAFEVGDIRELYTVLQNEVNAANGEGLVETHALGIVALLRRLRIVLAADGGSPQKLPYREIRLAEKAMAWLEVHYKEEFSLQRLAAELHISPYYLSHMFKVDTGGSLTEYVTAKRLREACLLLQNTDLSVAEIALRIGLATASHFIHTFKKHMGTTPLKFRQLSQKLYMPPDGF
ncbi:helix-turn-helix transcriptional regulator [Paenibacillus sp. Soil750]|uniref:helix-turn-helix transcriptional regulator n=1 Tax=Paenibacillus sp. Soil750 TaxID=1736398 RepID=UPI0006F55BE8|nr:helix-turn-helix domain-containing protein [Paenibacillus sp. Soil750]KRE70439.1 hypothetical protein ASL11_12055 [Paenibacillus sp. Soil750]